MLPIHKKVYLRIIVQSIFYICCAGVVYFFYRWTPAPIQPIHLPIHHVSLPTPSLIPSVTEYYYQVFVNERDTQDISLFIKDKQGRLWVSAKNIVSWGLKQPAVLPITYNKEKFYSLSQFPGLTYRIDQENLIE